MVLILSTAKYNEDTVSVSRYPSVMIYSNVFAQCHLQTVSMQSLCKLFTSWPVIYPFNFPFLSLSTYSQRDNQSINWKYSQAALSWRWPSKQQAAPVGERSVHSDMKDADYEDGKLAGHVWL